MTEKQASNYHSHGKLCSKIMLRAMGDKMGYLAQAGRVRELRSFLERVTEW